MELMAAFDQHAPLAIYACLFASVVLAVHVYFSHAVAGYTGTEVLKHHLLNAAMVDPSLQDTVVNALNACNTADVQALEAGLASATGPGAWAKDAGVDALLGVCAGGAVLLWLAQAYRRYRAGTGVFGFKRGAVLRELAPLALLAVPLAVELLMFYLFYARYQFFTTISLVQLVKTVRLQQELRFLAANQPSPGDVDPAKPCFSNCLTPADRLSLAADLKTYVAAQDAKVAAATADAQPGLLRRLLAVQGVGGMGLAAACAAGVAALLVATLAYHRAALPVAIGFGVVVAASILLLDAKSADAQTAASADFNSATASVLFCPAANPPDAVTGAVGRRLFTVDNAISATALQASAARG